MSNSSATESSPSQSAVVSDLLVFQVKLWLEGFKDVVLVPLSLGAAIFDLLFPRKEGQSMLYELMRAGKRFERWIDLYGAIEEEQTIDAQSVTSNLNTQQVSLRAEQHKSNGKDSTVREESIRSES